MATAYAYGRVSHVDQVDGDSVPAQAQRTEKYYDFALKSDGVLWGGFEHDQRNISAYKRSFFKRPAGRRLMGKLEHGDHIIFDKVDRIWRSNEDFVDLMRWFKARSITVHFVSFSGCSIRMGTPMGDFMLRFFVSQAELEAARTGERSREGKAYRRLHGLCQNGRKACPMGCRLTGRVYSVGGRRINNLKLEWDREMRALMKEMVKWDNEGRTMRWICAQAEKMDADAAGETYDPDGPRKYSRIRVTYLIRRERALQWLGGNPDPNTLNFVELERKYLEAKWAESAASNAIRMRAIQRWSNKNARELAEIG